MTFTNRINRAKTAIILLLMVPLSIFAQDWELIWFDEFVQDGWPDDKKWSYETGMIRNQEAQYYTVKRRENARVQDGLLIIEARKENYKNAKYTSASLTTNKKKHFLYGKIEVRVKVPAGVGTWPAIWMLGENIKEVGWPLCGEIDILENVGYDPDVVHANVHTKDFNHTLKTNKGNSITIENLKNDFHVYSIEWSKDKIDFFIDECKYFTFINEYPNQPEKWPFNQPHYLILNLAIGGTWGGEQGIDNKKFPHLFLIDYVRVYQKQ